MPSQPATLLAMRQSSNFGECYITASYAKLKKRLLGSILQRNSGLEGR